MKYSFFKYQNFSLLYLIIVGELIFALPFHVSRFFRPSLIEDFGYSNTMLGIAFSVYGITALISYIPGGVIADKFLPRHLLFISLLLTAFGGIFLIFNPNFFYLCLIYGFWGITTILFFWAALIKATRGISEKRQGLSFGTLEAGRGFVASLSATVAVFIFTSEVLVNFYFDIFKIKITSLSLVIFFYSFITFLSAFMILFLFKDSINKKVTLTKNILYVSIKSNAKSIFSIAIVVLSAYTGYKGIDYYSLYFYNIMGYSKEESAILITNLSYLRPISAILAGFIADKITSNLSSKIMFISLIISYFILSFIDWKQNISFFLLANFVISMIAIFSMRGIFYSLLKEVKIPVNITGVSVGIISLIGYFPDVFVGPIFGYILDNNNDINAYKLCFIFLLFVAILGLLSCILMPRKKNN